MKHHPSFEGACLDRAQARHRYEQRWRYGVPIACILIAAACLGFACCAPAAEPIYIDLSVVSQTDARTTADNFAKMHGGWVSTVLPSRSMMDPDPTKSIDHGCYLVMKILPWVDVAERDVISVKRPNRGHVRAAEHAHRVSLVWRDSSGLPRSVVTRADNLLTSDAGVFLEEHYRGHVIMVLRFTHVPYSDRVLTAAGGRKVLLGL